MGTLAVSVVLVGIVAAIIASLIKDKRSGKVIGCGCGCKSCPKQGSCAPDMS